MKNTIFDELNKRYSLTKCPVNKYKSFKAKPLKAQTEKYHIAGLGGIT